MTASDFASEIKYHVGIIVTIQSYNNQEVAKAKKLAKFDGMLVRYFGKISYKIAYST